MSNASFVPTVAISSSFSAAACAMKSPTAATGAATITRNHRIVAARSSLDDDAVNFFTKERI